MLGLGLGLNKGGYVKPLPKWLTDAGCTFAINVDRQVRSIANPNSPLQNPLTDVTGKLGKNLLQLFQPLVITSGVSFDSGFIPIKLTGNILAWKFYSDVQGTILATPDANLKIRFYDANKNFVDFWGLSPNPRTITNTQSVTDLTAFYKIEGLSASLPTVTQTIRAFQLELGTVATAYEPYGFNNVLMQSVAGTTADGYVQVALPNGKTPYFFKFDGTDTYGIGVNNADTDVIGTGNFGFPYDFITAPTLTNSFLESKAELSEATSQFGLKITSTGNLQLWLNGVAITVATGLVPNTFYHVVIVREAGVLKCEVNGVETYSQANVVNILTKPNFRLGAISSNAGGTTHTLFTNVFFGVSAIFQGTKCTMASVKKAYNKLASNYL